MTFAEGDEVEGIAVINNFLTEEQTVILDVDTLIDAGAAAGTPWADVLSGDGVSVTIPALSVRGVPIRVRARVVGSHPLRLRATGGVDVALTDAIERRVTVKAAGRELPFASSGTIDDDTTEIEIVVDVPANATANATELVVDMTGDAGGEVVAGLDSLLQQPSGCFEQTSSTTYPNILVLDYLGTTGQLTPELEVRARALVADGYQRLVSYEVPGGGFSWFGDAPAHNVLTAYGLMELVDMSRVHAVDPALLDRTAAWLASLQEDDGRFEPTAGGIAEGAINSFERDTLRTTAYVAWALAHAGRESVAVQRALTWLVPRLDTLGDPYALAVVVNALASAASAGIDVDALGDSDGAAVLASSRLASLATVVDGAAAFSSAEPSQLAPSGALPTASSILETTALAALGWHGAHREPQLVEQALKTIAAGKDSFGTWEGTQATIRSLQALIATAGTGGALAADVEVLFDEAPVATFAWTDADASLLRRVDLSELADAGTHVITLRHTGSGRISYRAGGRAFLPRDGAASSGVVVTRTISTPVLAPGESVDVDLVVTTPASFEQLIVELPIPAGFEVDLAALEEAKAAGKLLAVEEEDKTVVLYAEQLLAGEPLALRYALRARLPATVLLLPAKARPYYDAARVGESAPATLVVE